ncbi:MAG: cell division protein ZapA [Desulfobulbaceae bacterium]|nr:cell division protein ZapA [Desulfobulbaceae bacterium]
MERLVHFELFGQEFSFYTDASREDVDHIIKMVRAELDEEGSVKRTSLPSNKILVLCCLKIAARYIQLEKEFSAFRSRQDASIDKLINKVSSGME